MPPTIRHDQPATIEPGHTRALTTYRTRPKRRSRTQPLRGPSALPADVATDARNPFELFAALIVGGYDWLGFTPSDGGPAETWLTHVNGSWACHVTDADGKHTVRQGGPVRLWDSTESAHLEWQQLGQPSRQRFGLTVKDGWQAAWLDRPDGPHRWGLNL